MTTFIRALARACTRTASHIDAHSRACVRHGAAKETRGVPDDARGRVHRARLRVEARASIVGRETGRRWDRGGGAGRRDLSSRARATGTRDGGRTSTLAMPIMTLSNAHRGASANAIAFSRDGRGLASGGSDKTTALWRTSDGASGNTNYATLVGCKNAVTGCVYTMDDECVVTSDADGIVRVWDAETGTQAKSYASTRGKCANDVSAARGDVIASVGDDGNACVWDLRVKKKAVRKMAIGVPQTCVELSADGERAYTAGVDEVVRAWDARMDGKAILTLSGHEDTVTGLALSPCGSYLLSNAMDNTLRMWDTRAFVEANAR